MKHSYNNTVDSYFRDIINECRQFLTLHGIEVVTKEMQEGIGISNVTKIAIKIVNQEENEDEQLRSYYIPLDQPEVNPRDVVISSLDGCYHPIRGSFHDISGTDGPYFARH